MKKAIGNKPFMMNNITRKRERKKTEIAIFNITLLYLVTANYNIITKQRTTAGQPVTKQSGRDVGRKKKQLLKNKEKGQEIWVATRDKLF